MTILFGLPLALWALLGILVGSAGIVTFTLWPEREPRQRVTPNADRLASRAERRRREIRQTRIPNERSAS